MRWPDYNGSNAPVITPYNFQSIGWALGVTGNAITSGATATWPANNKAFFYPFRIKGVPWTARQAFVLNGSTASGNVDIGIYDRRGNLLVSTGATAQAGTNVTQLIDVTDTALDPGLYFMALSLSSTVGTVMRVTAMALQALAGLPCWIQNSAHPLPNPATFAQADAAYVPSFGFTTLTV